MAKEKLTKKDLGKRKHYDNCFCIRWGKGDGKNCYQQVEKLTFDGKVFYAWVDRCKSLDAVHNKVLGKVTR